MKLLQLQIRGAQYAYESGGLITLARRTVAYLWKEFAWFFISHATKNQLIVRKIYGNTMYLNLKDNGISKELAVFKTHEPITTELLRHEIKNGMRVVDIGANIGYYALQEAQLVGKQGAVLAIEPAPESIKILMHNIQANGYNNIYLYPIAIGTEDGIANLYSSDYSNLSSLLEHSNSNGNCFTVNTRSLDSLLKNEQCIDFLQMDMEGYEVEAIDGMQEILKRDHPQIFLELHPLITGPDKAINMLNKLKELGYSTKYTVDKAFNYPYAGNPTRAVETMSIDDLIIDKRVTKGRAVLNIFLESVKKY